MKHFLTSKIFFSTIFFNIILFSATKTQAQLVAHIMKVHETGLNISLLDNTYPSALHADSTLGVFKDQEKEFQSSYLKMINDLASFLRKNSLTFTTTVEGFNRIYFNDEGHVDYYLYQFKPNQLSAEKEKLFVQLTNQFLGTYTFPMKTESNFSQCSPFSIVPAN